jgi:hypothetical protein
VEHGYVNKIRRMGSLHLLVEISDHQGYGLVHTHLHVRDFN